MKKVHFSIFINVPVEKVWNTMLDDVTYRIWTEVFHVGSYYKGDWNEGSKILFLGPNNDGTEGGMVSRIAENRLHQFVSIEHQGIVVSGIEDTTSDEAKKWAPAFENYTFTKKEGGTELSIDVDVLLEYEEMMTGMWPKALEKLKEISEK